MGSGHFRAHTQSPQADQLRAPSNLENPNPTVQFLRLWRQTPAKTLKRNLSREGARGFREGKGAAGHSRATGGRGRVQRRALLSTLGLDLAASESLAYQPKP